MDVLDGTHSTDRIQASVIEGLLYNYDAIVYAVSSTIYARKSDGTLLATPGSDFKTQLQAALDLGQTKVIVIKPGSYVLNDTLLLRGFQTIIAYGVTITCTGGTPGFTALLAQGAGNKSGIKIYGLTLDFNNNASAANWEGVVTGTQQVNPLLLQDCTFKKPYTGSALVRVSYVYVDPGAQTKKNEGIRIDNCVFDGTSGVGSSSLCLLENCSNSTVRGCSFINAGSTKRAALELYGGCADSLVTGNAFYSNNDVIADCYIRQGTNIRVIANNFNTRLTLVDSRYITISANRIRNLTIADNDEATFDSHTAVWRGSENISVSNNFFQGVATSQPGATSIDLTTTDKNIIIDNTNITANPPKRISIVGNHAVVSKMFIDFLNATGTVSNQMERIEIADNVIATNSGTNAATTADGGLIRLSGTANWTTGGFKDVFITGNFFSATSAGTSPNDITLGRTDFSNVVIRDNWFNNAGVSNVNSYAGTISRNFGTATTTRFANSGTSSGSTSPITVTHGVSYTPLSQHIFVTPTTAWGSTTNFYVNNITSTTFDIVMSPAPGQSVTFAWQVARRN